MKYIGIILSFIVGIGLLFLVGSYVWNVFSGSFLGVDFDLGSNSTSTTSDDVVVFDNGDNEDDSQRDLSQGDSNENIETEVPASQREGSVYISSVRRSSSFSRPQEVTLRTDLEGGESLNITGWSIVTNENKVTIPLGVNFYNVAGSNQEGSVIVDEGDTIRIYFGESPIDNNLRLNMCTGFLNQKYDLDNFFPERCPDVPRSEYRHLSGDCQDYIRSINGRCEIPTSDELNSFPGSKEGNECRRFLSERFNAGYCYRKHDDDQDFLSDEWRIWIDESEVLDPEHDWVRLFNNQNTLIDERDY